MNIKIEVFQDGSSIFKGKLLNLPFKSSSINEKSMELFGDDEPCVIHQSYVIRLFAEEMADALTSPLNYKDHAALLNRLEFDDLEKIIIQRRAQ